jgi:hypothetical protein
MHGRAVRYTDRPLFEKCLLGLEKGHRLDSRAGVRDTWIWDIPSRFPEAGGPKEGGGSVHSSCCKARARPRVFLLLLVGGRTLLGTYSSAEAHTCAHTLDTIVSLFPSWSA